MTSRGARLRERLSGKHLLVAPGVLDPFTAKIVESLGFEALYLGGNAMGLHLGVGQPFVTLTETVESAIHVMRAVDVPVIIDFGAGFGEPAHLRRAIGEAENAGVAALHIDDQPYPKRAAYHRGAGSIVPVHQFAARMRSAVQARSSELVIIARIDALRVTGSLHEVSRRAHAAAEAGADAIVVLDMEPGHLAQLSGRLPGVPIAWIGATSAPGPTVEELETAGFALALYPFNSVAAVVDAMSRTWSPLLARGRLDQDPAVLARAKQVTADLLDLQSYWDIEAATVEQREWGLQE